MARVVFGPFELDTLALELWQRGTKVALRPQPCKVLALLASRPDQLVTREEIRRAVWPSGVYVRFDLGLNSCLKQIRHALGESGRHPVFLQTLPGRGYRFRGVVDVRPEIAVPDARRITILPFSTGGRAPQSLADGLVDELVAHLLEGAAFVVVDDAVLGQRTTLRAAVSALRAAGVDWFLQGRVRSDAQGLRVTARLVETTGLTHCWAGGFESPGDEGAVTQLGAQMARAIATAASAARRPGLSQPVHHDVQGGERTGFFNGVQRDQSLTRSPHEYGRRVRAH